MNSGFLEELYGVLQDRKNADPEHSYVAALYKKGTPKIAQKIGEEATELVIEALRLEAKDTPKRRDALTHEMADLLFHMMVLQAHFDIPFAEVLAVLEDRFGTGGLREKASRSKGAPAHESSF